MNSLFQLLKRGYTVDLFLEDFPTVTREQINEVLDSATLDIPQHALVVTPLQA